MSNILAEDGKRNSSGEYGSYDTGFDGIRHPYFFKASLLKGTFPMTWMSSLPAFLLIH